MRYRVVLTTYAIRTVARKATNTVKAISSPGSFPSSKARRRVTTPIPRRNPMLMPTAIMVRILVLIGLDRRHKDTLYIKRE